LEIMSIEAYDDLLKRARAELTPEEQRRFVEQLARGVARDLVPDVSGDSGKSLHDALEERGTIGAITNGPGDLSTNPTYLEGFGQDGE
jgi:hypothetical protein